MLFEKDDFTGPSPALFERILSAARSWRVNNLARATLVAVGVATLLIGAFLLWQAQLLAERARNLRNTSLVSLVGSLRDPLLRTLVLAELDSDFAEHDPLAGDLIRDTARRPIASSVLRGAIDSVSAMAISPEGDGLASADDSGDILLWKLDGRGDPSVLARLPWAATSLEFTPGGDLLLARSGSGAALLRIQSGEVQSFFGSSRFRLAADGKMLVEILRDGGVRCRALSDGVAGPPVDLPEAAKLEVVDVWADPGSDPSSFSGTVLGVAGEVLNFDRGQIRARGHIDLGDGGSVQLELPTNVENAFFAGGRAFAVTGWSGEGLVVARLEGGRSKVLYRDRRKISGWSADSAGRRLLLALPGPTYETVELATGKTKALEPPRPEVWRSNTRLPPGSFKEQGVTPSADEGYTRGTMAPTGDFVLLVSTMEAWILPLAGTGRAAQLVPGTFFDEGVPGLFGPDGRYLVIADRLDIRVWRPQFLRSDPQAIGPPSGSFCIQDDGRFLLGPRDGGLLAGHAGDTLELASSTEGVGTPLVGCRFSGNGLAATAVFADRRWIVLDSWSGALRSGTRLPESAGDMARSQILLLNDALAILRIDGRLWSWRFTTDRPPAAWVLRGTFDLAVAAEEEGLLLTVEKDNGRAYLRRYQADGGGLAAETELPQSDSYWDLATNADGSLAVVALDGGGLFWWSSFGSLPPQPQYVEGIDGSAITSIALSPNGKSFAAGTMYGRLGIGRVGESRVDRWLRWPENGAVSGKADLQLAHLGIVTRIAFSRDGSQLASASGMEGTLRIWKTSGEALAGFQMRDGEGELFDGFHRIAALVDDQLMLWSTSQLTILARFGSRTTAVLLPAERVRYLGEQAATAVERYRAAERRFERTPLPPEYGDQRFGIQH